MPKYLLLAEKISKNIKQDSSSNYLKSLNNRPLAKVKTTSI
nr:hypothetical protein [Acinetobacter sp. FDAARGOS_558]